MTAMINTTRQGFVRGVAARLSEQGHVPFASEDHYKEACAWADRQWTPTPQVTQQDILDLAGLLKTASDTQYHRMGKVASTTYVPRTYDDVTGDLVQAVLELADHNAKVAQEASGTVTRSGMVDAPLLEDAMGDDLMADEMERRPLGSLRTTPGSPGLADVPDQARKGTNVPMPTDVLGPPAMGPSNSLEMALDNKTATPYLDHYAAQMKRAAAGSVTRSTDVSSPRLEAAPGDDLMSDEMKRRPMGSLTTTPGSPGLANVPAQARKGTNAPAPTGVMGPRAMGPSNSLERALDNSAPVKTSHLRQIVARG